MLGKGGILDRDQIIGLILLIFGAWFAAVSYNILNIIPFTALGLACIVLGVSIAMVPDSPRSNQLITTMAESSCVQVEAMLDDTKAKERAVYSPNNEGKIVTYIPLNPNYLRNKWKTNDTSTDMVTTIGSIPTLIVTPPGSEIVRLAGLERGGDESDVEKALTYVFVEFLEAAESVKSYSEGEKVFVLIKKPRISTNFSRFNAVLGSYVTSISGCVVAHVLDKPMRLVDEQVNDAVVRAIFEVPSTYGKA